MSDLDHLLDELVERVARRVVELLGQDGSPERSAPAPHLGVEEAAAILAVDHKTVRRLIDGGELPAKRVGRVWRIDPADLQALAVPTTGGNSSRPPAGRYARLARGDLPSGPGTMASRPNGPAALRTPRARHQEEP